MLYTYLDIFILFTYNDFKYSHTHIQFKKSNIFYDGLKMI